MTQYYKTNTNELFNTMLLFFMLGLIFLFPDSIKGSMAYFPQIIIATIAIIFLLKVSINKTTKSFLIFAIFLTMMNIIITSSTNNEDISSLISSSMRLYYPFVGLIIGAWLKKNIRDESLIKVLLIFLVVQFMVSYLQINNEGFRVWSFTLYRTSNIEGYLLAYTWEAGKRAIGTIGNPNILGLLAVILNSTILVMSESLKNRFIKRLFIIISVFSSVYISIYSQSRTALILWVLTLAFIVYMKYSKKSLRSILFAVVAIVIVVVLLNIMQDSISRDIRIEAFDSRLEIWKLRLQYFFERDIYINNIASIVGIGYSSARNLGTFDNIYLKYFIAGGFIGFALFLKTLKDVIKVVYFKLSNKLSNQLGKVIVLVWILGGFVTDYQEMFKLSIVTFMIIGYAIYSITNEVKMNSHNYKTHV